MNSETYNDPLRKWRDLVGGFILSFGDIELMTFHLWREHLRVEPIPHNFKERAGRVLSALRRAPNDHSAIIDALEKALRLADKRNTVAHHPLQVQVFEHSRTGEVFFQQAIASEISDDYIDDAELTELRAETEELATRLFLSLGYVDPRERSPQGD